MNQTSIGKAIKDAILFLQPIYADTARALTIVEDTMVNRYRLTSLWGSASVWKRSQAFYGAHSWLTHYLNRLYVNLPQNNEKASFKGKKGVFVNVYFAPEALSQAVIVYGAIQLSHENIDPVWNALLAVNGGPPFINQECVKEWAKYTDANYPELETLIYKVMPLVEINSKEIVVSICSEAFEEFKLLRS
jgi:hypothetical protein